jgi:plastocyanin
MDQTTTTGTARWTRLANLGLTMIVVGPLLPIAAVLIWGLDAGDIGFFLIPVLAGVIGSVLMRRSGRTPKIIAIVLAVIGGGLIFWTVFGIGLPASFFDFVPGLLILPGVLITLIAGIGSIRATKRGDLTSGLDGGEGRAVRGILGVIAVLTVVSAILSVTGRESVSAADKANADLTVTLSDFEFDHDSYDITGGQTVLVVNDDPFHHTFSIDALDIDLHMDPGSETLVAIPEEPGDYIVYCSPHTSDKEKPGEDDMAATLAVG